MRRFGLLKKLTKGLVSLLLVLAVMVSLAVPFELTVFAEEGEDPAGPGEMHALVYVLDPTRTNTFTTGLFRMRPLHSRLRIYPLSLKKKKTHKLKSLCASIWWERVVLMSR